MVSTIAAVWKAVDEEVALIRRRTVSALDAGVVVFWLVAAVSVDYDMCRRVPATGGAESCSEEEKQSQMYQGDHYQN